MSESSFSENWHRVSELKPHLAPAVQVSRQSYRGRLWFVLRDPLNDETFRLHEAAYRFVGLLEGRRTVSAAWRICNEQLGDAALTQPEVVELLAWLHSSNLLQADLPANAQQLLRRKRRKHRRQVGGAMLNVLAARIPLLDPDRFLERWNGLLGWCFSRAAGLAWALLLIVGLSLLAGRFGQLTAESREIFSGDPLSLLLLYLSFALLKAMHELGHAVACKKFGKQAGRDGAVHAMGLTFLVFTPLPYVDVSSAWMLPSRWQRALIGAAGMYVELAAAALAAIAWASTGPGLVHELMFRLIFWASVTTVLFNVNPLLRFDGYYILSDLLEIPNLDSRSKARVAYLVRKFLFGVRSPVDPAHTSGERFWLPLYALAAGLYRIFICWVILLFVIDHVPSLGIVIAVLALVGWVLVPLGRGVNYLLTHGELARVRGRAVAICGIALLVMVAGLGLAPAPDWGVAQGLVEPQQMTVVHPKEAGFVIGCLPDGTAVTPDGPPVLVSGSDELDALYQQWRAERELTVSDLRRAESENAAGALHQRQRLAVIEQQLQRLEERRASLTVRATFAGVWLAPQARELPGAFLEPGGDSPGMIAALNSLVIRVAADQQLGPRIASEAGQGASVRIRPLGQPDSEWTGRIQRIIPAGQQQLPSAALGKAFGGALATQAGAQTRGAEPVFEAVIDLGPQPAGAAPLLVGQRVLVQFSMPAKPLGVQWVRALAQLLQRRFRI